MANIFQRFGTKPMQYQIDIILHELVINVEKQVDMSVVLKRGDHRSETKTAVPLKNFRCKFNKQVLSVPTKLYWDDKKKEFLQKLAELQINLIHDKKVRCAGKIEFDVAYYANNKIMSKNEQSKLQKCPDPSAKLLYEIRVHKFGDSQYYEQKEKEEQESRNKAKSNMTSARGRDVSPMMDTSHISTRQKIQDLDQFDARSKSPITKIEHKRVSFRKNDSNQGAQEDQLKQTLFQAKKPNEDKTSSIDTVGMKLNDKEVKNLKSTIDELKEENTKLKTENDTIKKENQRLKSKVETYEASTENSQNLSSSETMKKAHKQEIQSYEEQIKSLNESLNKLKGKDNASDDQQKYLSEKKLKDLEFALEDFKQKVKDLQNEVQKKQKDVDYYKDLNNRRNKEETENEHMLDLQKQIQELERKLETTEKNSEQKIRELQEENKSIRKDKESELQKLRFEKSQSENEYGRIQKEKEEFQKQAKNLENQYKKLQSNFSASKEDIDNQHKLKQLQSKYDEVSSRLQSLSTSTSNLENENKNLKLQIKHQTEDAQQSQQMANQMESKLKSVKENFCHIVNIVMMTGDRDLNDDIECYLDIPDQLEQDQNQLQFATVPNSQITPTPGQFQMTPNENKQNDIYNLNNNFVTDNPFNY